MARRDSKCPRAKQVNMPQRSSKHYSSTPLPAHGRPTAQGQPQQARNNNSNSTVLNLVHTLEQQACTNGTLLDVVRKEKASNALLNVLLHQSMDKVKGHKQTLAIVNADLSRTTQTLEYATGQLQATQDELQQADDCIHAQDHLLQEKTNTISSLQANVDVLIQDNEELARRNDFTQKQLAFERINSEDLRAKLKNCNEKLAAAEHRNNHLAERNSQLQAAVAGDCTALFCAALAGGPGCKHLVWLAMLPVMAAIQSCVLLHVLMFNILFIMLSKGLAAAPWLLREARVWGVVSCGLVCDLLRYLLSGAAGYWHAHCANLVKASGAAAAGYSSRVYVGCVGLVRDTMRRAKSLVCSGRCASLNLWSHSSEPLLPHRNSWGSTPAGSACGTPACSNRTSIDADAVRGSVQDDVAADVLVLVALKQGMVVGKDVKV